MSPKKTPREDLVEEFERLSEELGEPPTSSEMQEHGDCSVGAYVTEFGSWSDAVETISGQRSKYDPNTKATEADLKDHLRELADELGETPTGPQMETHGNWSAGTYEKRFGSWNEAVRAAGLTPQNDTTTKATREELIQAIEELHDELGRTPTRKEMNERGRFSRSPYDREFGSWNTALEAAGLEKNHENDKDRVPVECEVCGDVVMAKPSVADEKRFCSYECLGKDRSGKDHPRWKPFEELVGANVPNWGEIKAGILERDGYKCRVCEVGQEEWRSKHGYDLDVHHIKPIKSYLNEDGTVDWGAANEEENLVTLCRSCHNKYEEKPRQLADLI